MTPRRSVGDRLFRWLLRLLPAEFRGDFGDAMTADVEAAKTRGLTYWWREVRSLLAAAVREHVDGVGRDFTYARRTLQRAPGFSLAAVLTLALGIGASASVFAAVDAIVLRPLPFERPDRLVAVGTQRHDRTAPEPTTSTPQDFLDWRNRQLVFEQLAGYATGSVALLEPGQPAEALDALRVSAEFFDVLGVRPHLGRTFSGDHERPGSSQVVVLGHDLWRRRFGGSPDIIGATIVLDDVRYEVIGVTPRTFTFPGWYLGRPQVWVPLVIPDEDRVRSRQRRSYDVDSLARLKDGVTLEQAASAMNQLALGLEAEYPSWNQDSRIAVVPLHDYVSGGPTKSWMLVLLGAVTCVLLLVYANVAGLMLARGSARGREIGIRMALGAGRGRLIRQLLMESLVLSLVGSFLGLVLASWGVGILRSGLPEAVPRIESVALDVRVLVASVGAALVTALAFGLIPAVRLSRASLRNPLNDAAGAVAAGTWPLRRAIVAAEVALTVVLLVGAGLFMRSFVNLTSVPLGFDPAGVLSGSIAPRADGNAVRPFGPRLGDFLRRLEQVPGVEAASAYAGTLPLYGYSFTSYGPRDRIRFSRQYVTPDYHRAMRIPLRRGRYLSPTDGADVVLINESAARSLSGDADPIGQVAAGGRRVVGVVGDVRLIPEGEVDPIAYVPFGEDLSSHDIYLAVRTAGAPMDVAPAVRAIAADVLPGLPIRGIRSLDAVLSGLTAQRRLSMQLLGLFGLLGIVIAVIGIYGIVSYVVSLRTKEIGLRIALGATRARILTLLLRGAFAVAGAGLLAGLVGAWWLGVRVEPFLFRLEPTDKAVFAAACVLLAVAAAAASVVPALRALRIDPVKTLRCE